MNSIIVQNIFSLSGLGETTALRKSLYEQPVCSYELMSTGADELPVVKLNKRQQELLSTWLQGKPALKKLDRSVLMAMYVAEKVLEPIETDAHARWAINAGSSRGATGLWEKYHTGFIEHGNIPAKTSPLTTSGNIASNIAQMLHLQGFTIDHSITCGTGLQALANGFAWLRSGLVDQFMAVGTEASVTPFTLAQMQALGIYTTSKTNFPCRPCSAEEFNQNSFMLGEGAAAVLLSSKPEPENGDLVLAGIGAAVEKLSSPTSVSRGGEAFRKSMRMALDLAEMMPQQIDMVIAHSPGTVNGDQSEESAIQHVFDRPIPVISNKFLAGHTLGTSGLLSLQTAADILKNGANIQFPYASRYPSMPHKTLQHIMVNAMGFGGNAISIILSK